MERLDTPGILWPKFEDQNAGLKLAFTGAIKDELYSFYELAILLIKFLSENYPSVIGEFYQIEDFGVSESEILELIAIRRGCIKSGAKPDLDKAGRYLIDDFRASRLGKITLEKPNCD